MRASLILLLLVPALAGCLRTRIDLCAQVPPHPECAYLDAGRDASPADAGPTDAPLEDAPDAPVEDAPAPADAATDG